MFLAIPQEQRNKEQPKTTVVTLWDVGILDNDNLICTEEYILNRKEAQCSAFPLIP